MMPHSLGCNMDVGVDMHTVIGPGFLISRRQLCVKW